VSFFRSLFASNKLGRHQINYETATVRRITLTYVCKGGIRRCILFTYIMHHQWQESHFVVCKREDTAVYSFFVHYPASVAGLHFVVCKREGYGPGRCNLSFPFIVHHHTCILFSFIVQHKWQESHCVVCNKEGV
jgi:hypothetical protein